MIKNIIEDEAFKQLASKQINELITFLLERNQEFSITANVEAITFQPELPDVIKQQLQRFSLFTLSNYTYTTIALDEEYINFEAGFGSENFGSTVKIPLYAIFQIVVDESILHINSVATVEKFNKTQKRSSLDVFKNNPMNKKFK